MNSALAQRLVFRIHNNAYSDDDGGGGGGDFCCCFDYFNFIFIVFDILIFDYLFPWCVPSANMANVHTARSLLYCSLELNVIVWSCFLHLYLIFYLFHFILALIKFIQSHIYYIIHIIINDKSCCRSKRQRRLTIIKIKKNEKKKQQHTIQWIQCMVPNT